MRGPPSAIASRTVATSSNENASVGVQLAGIWGLVLGQRLGSTGANAPSSGRLCSDFAVRPHCKVTTDSNRFFETVSTVKWTFFTVKWKKVDFTVKKVHFTQ